MTFKQLANLVFPNAFKNKINIYKHLNELKALPKTEYFVHNLRRAADIPAGIFKSDTIEKFWQQALKAINEMELPDSTGGVNPGDRKAIFHLICALRPASVLEIGTHIGASTLQIAAALHISGLVQDIKDGLTTVDIVDVNCETKKAMAQIWIDLFTSRDDQQTSI